MVIKGPEIVLNETDAVCTHAFASILPYIVALRKDIKPREIGLGTGKKAYVQCPDPGPPYTEGGSVVFEITREGDEDEAKESVGSSEGSNK